MHKLLEDDLPLKGFTSNGFTGPFGKWYPPFWNNTVAWHCSVINHCRKLNNSIYVLHWQYKKFVMTVISIYCASSEQKRTAWVDVSVLKVWSWWSISSPDCIAQIDDVFTREPLVIMLPATRGIALALSPELL